MSEDCVQFRQCFTAKDSDGDHVEEIRFDEPLYLTGFEVSGLQERASTTRLRVYAKDALCLASGRLVPLFDGAVESRETPKQRFELPKTVSDHVLLRGRFEKLDFALLGRSYVLALDDVRQATPLEKTPISYGDCTTPFEAASMPLPYLDGFPEPLANVIIKAAKGIELDTTDSQTLFGAANHLCSLLGLTQTTAAHSDPTTRECTLYRDDLGGDGVVEISAEQWVGCTRAVTSWMHRLGSDGKHEEAIEAGMQSLALACLLCSCRLSVLHFLLNDGLASLAEMFKMRGATALMTRYIVCTAELISLTAGPLGCEALLGLLHSEDKTGNATKIDSSILHVPGIVSAKLSKEHQKTNRKTALATLSLPPGVVASHKKTQEEEDPREASYSKRETESDLEDSSKKRSSGSKRREKKKRKSKHKSSRDRSPDHRESKRSRDDKKRHSRRSVSPERSRKSSKLKEKLNGRTSKSREQSSRLTHPEVPSEKGPERTGPTVKRQKCDHPAEQGIAACLDLRKSENMNMSSVAMYDVLFEILLQPRPQGIIQSIKRLLDRLNLYKCLFDFQAAANEIVASLRDLPDSQSCFSFSAMSGVFSSIATCLERILTFMKDSIKKTTDMETHNGDTEYSKGVRMKEPLKLDSCMLEAVSAMDFFGQLKLAMHALTLPVQLESNRHSWNHIRREILKAASEVLLCFISIPTGLSLMLHHAESVHGLMVALTVESDAEGGCLLREGLRTFQQRMGFVHEVLKACQVLDQFPQDHSSALDYLSESVKEVHLQEALLCALTVRKGLFKTLTEMADAWNQPSATQEDSKEQSPSHPTCEMGPSVMRLMSDLARLAYHPSLLQELLDNSKAIQRSIALEKESENNRGSHQDALSYLDEFLGRIEAVESVSTSDPNAVLKELSLQLPELLKVGEKKRPDSVGVGEAVAVAKDPVQYGRLCTWLNILSSCMLHNVDRMVLAELYGSHLISTLERALMTAIKVYEVARMDTLTAVMTGDFKNDLHLSRAASQATELLCCTVHCLAVTLRRLHAVSIQIKATGCLKNLIQAYSLMTLSPENMSVILGTPPGKLQPILQARSEILELLLLWMEAGWKPGVLDVLFDSDTSFHHLSKPVQLFTNTCLLGDLIQDEWPPLPQTSLNRGALAPPSHMKNRAALARGLEMHAVAFRYLTEFAIGSESHMVRCVSARLCARSAGLGGGMGLFLVEPIMSEMGSLIKNGGNGSDYYRLVETLTALVPWPALKAAFLDVKLTSSVSRLLHGIAPDSSKDPSLLAICSAFLDVVSVLLDSMVCMDPFESREIRQVGDCPSASEMGVMVAALFANLHHLTGLQEKVLDLLKATVEMPDGRSILMRGISRWKTAHDASAELSTEGLMEWAIEKLTAPDSKPSQTDSIVQYLRTISLTALPEIAAVDRVPAPERFKALVLKTQDATQPCSVAEGGRQDVSLELFWKFVHSFPPYQLKKTWTKWNCNAIEAVSPFQYYTAQSVLTASCRPREILLSAAVYRPSREQSEAESVGNSATAKSLSDLPPVMALPRRGQESRRVKPGTSGSRQPSIHVDEYHSKPTEEETSQPKSLSEKQLAPTKQMGVNGGSGLKIASIRRETAPPERTPKTAVEALPGGTPIEIPGIPSLPSSLIPGIGLSQPVTSDRPSPYARDPRHPPNQPTGERKGDSDNSPVAPQLSQSSGDEQDPPITP